MPYRIAVDIGGTFTDCVVVDQQGERTVSKALTRYGALDEGVVEAVALNARQLGRLAHAAKDKHHGATVQL